MSVDFAHSHPNGRTPVFPELRAITLLPKGANKCYGASINENRKSQPDKFKEDACEHGVDDDVARWDERLKKLAKAKPAPEEPE